MDLLQLRYFCLIAKYQNITRAASELMISQPALSKSLKALESELGVRLFERQKKNIRLNKIGELFYVSATNSLQILDDAVSAVSDLNGAITGEVRVLVNAGSTFLPPLYIHFSRCHPYIKLTLSNYLQSEDPMYDCDLCIGEVPNGSCLSGNQGVTILTERMALAVSADNPLAGRDAVDLAEAANMPFIASNRRADTERFCAMAGFKGNVIIACDNGTTYATLIQSGVGVAIVPQITLGSVMPEGIRVLPLTNPIVERTLALSWNPDRYLSAAAACFADFCIDFFHNHPSLSKDQQPR